MSLRPIGAQRKEARRKPLRQSNTCATAYGQCIKALLRQSSALHPGTSVEQAREATGWDLRVADDLGTTDPPTAEELEILRDLRERTEAANKQMRVLDDIQKSRAAKR